MYDKIGNMVRYHRKKQGLTLINLAQLAGIGKTALFDIEHGKATCQLDTLMKVLDVLDIHLVFRTPTMDIAFKNSEMAEV